MYGDIIWASQFWLIFAGLSSFAFAELKITIEPPGCFTPNVTLRYPACEYFDSVGAGFKDAPFTARFPPNIDGIRGTYEKLLLAQTEGFGLVNHALVETGAETILKLTVPGKEGVNYFGAWVIAINHGNTLEFLLNGNRVRLVVYDDLLKAVEDNTHLGKYDRRFPGKFEAYFNFNCEACLFNEVKFSQAIADSTHGSGTLITDHHCIEAKEPPTKLPKSAHRVIPPDSHKLKITVEPSGSEMSTLVTDYHTCEYFDSTGSGLKSPLFETTFPPNFEGIKGTYENLNLVNEDTFGLGNHARVEAGAETKLNLTSSLPKEANYFGAWIIGIRQGNTLTFYSKKKRIRRVVHTDLLKAIEDNQPIRSRRYKYDSRDPGKPDAYFNFICDDCTFDEVTFSQERIKNVDDRGIFATDHHCVKFVTTSQPPDMSSTTETPKRKKPKKKTTVHPEEEEEEEESETKELPKEEKPEPEIPEQPEDDELQPIIAIKKGKRRSDPEPPVKDDKKNMGLIWGTAISLSAAALIGLLVAFTYTLQRRLKELDKVLVWDFEFKEDEDRVAKAGSVVKADSKIKGSKEMVSEEHLREIENDFEADFLAFL